MTKHELVVKINELADDLGLPKVSMRARKSTLETVYSEYVDEKKARLIRRSAIEYTLPDEDRLYKEDNDKWGMWVSIACVAAFIGMVIYGIAIA